MRLKRVLQRSLVLIAALPLLSAHTSAGCFSTTSTGGPTSPAGWTCYGSGLRNYTIYLVRSWEYCRCPLNPCAGCTSHTQSQERRDYLYSGYDCTGYIVSDSGWYSYGTVPNDTTYSCC